MKNKTVNFSSPNTKLVFVLLFAFLALFIAGVCFFAKNDCRPSLGSRSPEETSLDIVRQNLSLFTPALTNSTSSASSSEVNSHSTDLLLTSATPSLPGIAISSEPQAGSQDDHLSSKEEEILKRFGVVKRKGKWIPLTGEGSNVVYITTGSLPKGKVGEMYEIQFGAIGGTPPYTWQLKGGILPETFVFNESSGHLSGISAQPFNVSFLLEAADELGRRDMAEYVLIIQPAMPLTILTENLPLASLGNTFACQIQVEGGIPPYFWHLNGLHYDWGTLILDDVTGMLAGQINEAAPLMTVPVSIFVSDAQLTIEKTFDLHLRDGLSILNSPTSVVYVAENFQFEFLAEGGTFPYVWDLAGSLPPGLNFSAQGILLGQPSSVGTYEFRVFVNDYDGNYAAQDCFLKVQSDKDLKINNFTAFAGCKNIALIWSFPALEGNWNVHIKRKPISTPQDFGDGELVYYGNKLTCRDEDLPQGTYCYAAFLDHNGLVVTSVPPSVLMIELSAATDPFVDAVVESALLHPNAFRSSELPRIVLGPPRGTGPAWGSADVVSLGAAVNDDDGATAPYGGLITLEFVDNLVWNGPGVDFTVFENVFYIYDSSGALDPLTRFMEPAIVSVSQDGVSWRQFPTDFSPRYHPETGKLNLRHPYCYHTGFAGVNPVMSNGYDPDPTDPDVSGGDSFDLDEVGFDWIRYVRIQATGSYWLWDSHGNLIRHIEDSGAALRSDHKSGFDLDAVSAIWYQKVSADN